MEIFTNTIIILSITMCFVDTYAHVVDLNCDFDTDLCNWRQSTADDFDWTIGSDYDHTSRESMHLSIQALSSRQGYAALTSELLPPGDYCLSFWYTLNGSGVDLMVSTVNSVTEEQNIFGKTANLSSDLVRTKLGIKSDFNFQIQIIGKVHENESGEITIDDITFTSGWCLKDVSPSSLLECSFENDSCGWKLREEDRNIWSIKPASSFLTDHTAGDGHYIRAKINSLNGSSYQTTPLGSTTIDSGTSCFSAWYRVSDSSNLSLKIYTLLYNKNVNDRVLRSERRLDLPVNRWTQLQTDVSNPENFWVIMEVVFNQPAALDIDDVKLYSGLCDNGSLSVDCTFESGLCSWSSADSNDWTVLAGEDQHDSAYPTVDTTTRSKEGHYIYGGRSKGTKTIKASLSQSPGVHCFTMWYYMNGEGSRQLQLQMHEKSINYTSALFSKSGNLGDEWRFASVEINSTETFFLLLTAVFEDNSSGGIAVDDIHMTPGQCITDTNYIDFYQPVAQSDNETIDTSNCTLDLCSKATVKINDTTVVFEVKCQSDVRIILHTNSNRTIEVVISGQDNDRSEIDTHEGGYVSYTESNILTRSAYRAFWISWDDNSIRVGKGFIPSEMEFMHLNELHYDIKELSFPKSNQSDAYWRIYSDKFPHTTTTFIPTSSVLKTESSTLSSPVQGNEVIATAVATSCVVAVILALGIFILWRKRRYCTGMNQCWKENSDHDGKLKAVENITYTNTKPLHTENIFSAVSGNLQNTVEYVNLGFEPQVSNSEYNYVDVNARTKEENHAYGHLQSHHSEIASPEYSHIQSPKQGLNTDNVSTYDHTNSVNMKQNEPDYKSGNEDTYNAISSSASKNMSGKDSKKQEEDPAYDHASVTITEEEPNNEDEYSHLNEKEEGTCDRNKYALSNKKVPEEAMESRDSVEEIERHFVVDEKQDDEIEREIPPDIQHYEYFIIENNEKSESQTVS